MNEQQVRHAAPERDVASGHFPVWTAIRGVPRLYVMDGFASDAEVERVLMLTHDLDAWRQSGANVKQDATGASFELPVAADEVLGALVARTYDMLGVVNAVNFSVRFRHYRINDSHPLHTDTYTIHGAHLVATALLCLTEPEEGGSTDFPFASPPVRVQYRRGRMVSWLNLMPDGTEDSHAAHAGAPVTAGDKITLTNFIYADPHCRLVREGPACLRP